MVDDTKDSMMATEPVWKLMMKIGIPIVISMMLQAVYNIVDSIYLSHMKEAGEEALTALGLAFPIQLLMIAIAVGTGVGTNALLARSMGQGDRRRASFVVGNAALMGIVISIVFIIFGFSGIEWYANSQNKGGNISPIVIAMTIDYLKINCCISFGIVFFSIYEKILQAMGRSLYSTIAQITGAVVNIIFDPIMIYGWLGCPEMGVKGAAYATVLGQIVSAAMVFAFHLKFDKEIENGVKYLKPDRSVIKDIYSIGLPAIISQALLTVMTYGLNIILGNLPMIGENAVTVYGLYCKIQQMVIFAAVGLRDAITPVVSFNFGLGDKKRIKEGIKYGMVYTFIIMLICLILIEILTGAIVKLFALNNVTREICISCIRIVSLGFIFAGIAIAFQGVFQALDSGIPSLLISLGRQVVFIIPVAWFLSRFITGAENVSLIWWTFMIGEILTLICAIAMYIPVMRKKVEVLA